MGRYTLLTRRIPRGVLRQGPNRVHLRALVLPGPLRLPRDKQWPGSGSLDHGSVWHIYAGFRQPEARR